MKKMIEYLDADRDRVLTNLKTASSPADAQQILEKETDRLLLQYNEECTSLRVRDAAAGMVQALRSSVPFLDSMGEARLWQRDRAGSAGAGSAASSRAQGAGMSRILLGIGIILTAAAFAVPALSAGGTAALGSLLKGILLPLAGGGCLYFAGRTAGTNTRIRIGRDGAAVTSAEQRIEITIDPEKLWNSLRGAVMVIDRNLELTQETEEYDRRKELAAAAGAGGITSGEIELFSALLETADAESPQMAADIRYYLHKKNVEVLPWSEQNAAWFEMLPSLPGSVSGNNGTDAVETIRPALVQDGKLLKKGVAVR